MVARLLLTAQGCVSHQGSVRSRWGGALANHPSACLQLRAALRSFRLGFVLPAPWAALLWQHRGTEGHQLPAEERVGRGAAARETDGEANTRRKEQAPNQGGGRG